MLQWLRKLVSRIRSVVRRLLTRRERPAEPSHPFLSFTSILILTVIAIALAAIVAARLEHRWNYKQQIIIGDFLVTAQASSGDRKSGDMSVFGREISDLFASDVNDVIEKGSSFAGTSRSASSKYTQPFDGVPKVPVSKSYGIEIQGISVDQIIKAWNTLRYDQQQISGDVIPDSRSPNRYVLQISIRSENSDQQLTSPAFLPSSQELSQAVLTLAENFVSHNNPEIGGRYFLGSKRYAQAQDVFTEWMMNHPASPEPRLYLAKTFIMEGRFDRAQLFAASAGDRLKGNLRASAASRNKIQAEVDLADATAKWGNGDLQGAKELFSGSLANQSYALTNFGSLYLGTRDYQDAETEFKKAIALDPNNYGATLYLGETYSSENKYKDAETWFAKALDIRPSSAEAAEYYVEAAHDGKDKDHEKATDDEKAKDDEKAVAYCHSWIGTTIGSDPILSDPKSDLYSLCAQAELTVDQSKHVAIAGDSTLAWYYISALGATGESDRAELLQQQLYQMPDLLCRDSAAPAPQWSPPVPVENVKLLVQGRAKLLERLHKLAKDPSNHPAVALAKRCDAAAAKPQ
jgi:tetratricopeptide (TPR) repeat protein